MKHARMANIVLVGCVLFLPIFDTFIVIVCLFVCVVYNVYAAVAESLYDFYWACVNGVNDFEAEKTHVKISQTHTHTCGGKSHANSTNFAYIAMTLTFATC